MSVRLGTPGEGDLDDVVRALRDWQVEGAPVQLHPGDVGWFWSAGGAATAAALRTWGSRARTLAVGLLDGPGVLRLAVAPEAELDEELARQVLDDVTRPERGVLPDGPAAVEARAGDALRRLLAERGWTAGDPWTPLHRDLSDPVGDPGVRVVVVGPDQVAAQTAVHRSAFGSERFTTARWHAMAAGPAFTDARCLLAHDADGAAVATATVWSAGPGRPGLLEPVGVHADHHGRGLGRAVSLAAAAALREMGASSATVCTPGSNQAAVATYLSAGFQALPDVPDFSRPA